MPTRIRAGCAVAAAFIFVFASLVCAQEQAPSTDDFLAQTAQEATLEWLWGEATQVDSLTGTLTVKYLDYDTDTEKEMAVSIDEKTTFENASSVADIAVGDTLSIDYTVVGGGIRARNISVEKAAPEGITTEAVPMDAPMGAPLEPSIEPQVEPQAEPQVEPQVSTDAAVQALENAPDVSSVPSE